MLINPTHEHVSLDQDLTTKATQLFDRLLEFNTSESVLTIRTIIGGMYDRSFEAVRRAAANEVEEGPNPADASLYNGVSTATGALLRDSSDSSSPMKPDHVLDFSDPLTWGTAVCKGLGCVI